MEDEDKLHGFTLKKNCERIVFGYHFENLLVTVC